MFGGDALLTLFAVLGVILVVALIAGLILRQRFGPTEVITNLNAHIIA
ncbi:MAG: hypothetical protein NTX73_01140 [Rhodobacterales bacterium]|jgi:hypothetical protein|nr:hypothetical protein [Rhodobacterales bacterium]